MIQYGGMMNFMKGRLTYILAVIAIEWGVVGYTFGWADNEIALAAVWSGLAAFGLRRAIK